MGNEHFRGAFEVFTDSKIAFILYLLMFLFLAKGLVAMLVAVMFTRRLFLGHGGTWSGLTPTLHMINHRHHRFGISGPFVDVLNLHDLGKLRGTWESEDNNTNAAPVCDPIDVNV